MLIDILGHVWDTFYPKISCLWDGIHSPPELGKFIQMPFGTFRVIVMRWKSEIRGKWWPARALETQNQDKNNWKLTFFDVITWNLIAFLSWGVVCRKPEKPCFLKIGTFGPGFGAKDVWIYLFTVVCQVQKSTFFLTEILFLSLPHYWSCEIIVFCACFYF
jgi:hypothetical protein